MDLNPLYGFYKNFPTYNETKDSNFLPHSTSQEEEPYDIYEDLTGKKRKWEGEDSYNPYLVQKKRKVILNSEEEKKIIPSIYKSLHIPYDNTNNYITNGYSISFISIPTIEQGLPICGYHAMRNALIMLSCILNNTYNAQQLTNELSNNEDFWYDYWFPALEKIKKTIQHSPQDKPKDLKLRPSYIKQMLSVQNIKKLISTISKNNNTIQKAFRNKSEQEIKNMLSRIDVVQLKNSRTRKVKPFTRNNQKDFRICIFSNKSHWFTILILKEADYVKQVSVYIADSLNELDDLSLTKQLLEPRLTKINANIVKEENINKIEKILPLYLK
jgi:hypothetical protein